MKIVTFYELSRKSSKVNGCKNIIESAPELNDVTYYVTLGIPSRGNSQQGIPAGEKLAMLTS